jgi:hypothetical protein
MAAQDKSSRGGGEDAGNMGRRQETKRSSSVTGAGETSIESWERSQDPDYGSGGRDTDAPASLEDFAQKESDENNEDQHSTRTSIKEDRDGR